MKRTRERRRKRNSIHWRESTESFVRFLLARARFAAQLLVSRITGHVVVEFPGELSATFGKSCGVARLERNWNGGAAFPRKLFITRHLEAWRRGKSEYSGLLKARNLLIFRDAKNAKNGKIAANWNVSGTRDFSFAEQNSMLLRFICFRVAYHLEIITSWLPKNHRVQQTVEDQRRG